MWRCPAAPTCERRTGLAAPWSSSRRAATSSCRPLASPAPRAKTSGAPQAAGRGGSGARCGAQCSRRARWRVRSGRRCRRRRPPRARAPRRFAPGSTARPPLPTPPTREGSAAAAAQRLQRSVPTPKRRRPRGGQPKTDATAGWHRHRGGLEAASRARAGAVREPVPACNRGPGAEAPPWE
jgi:hypothetical protein